MGYKYSSDDILEAAMAAALADGLSQLTFGRLAKRIGIGDRTIVYYFPSKDDLISAVLTALGARLQASLVDAFTEPADNHLELAKAAWPRLARDDLDPVFGLFFELAGLAAAGREPYRELAVVQVVGWATWLEQFFTGTQARRRAEAEATVALVDGLLLFRQIAGPAAATRAAKSLGVG